jgi:hypothetical protein
MLNERVVRGHPMYVYYQRCILGAESDSVQAAGAGGSEDAASGGVGRAAEEGGLNPHTWPKRQAAVFSYI